MTEQTDGLCYHQTEILFHCNRKVHIQNLQNLFLRVHLLKSFSEANFLKSILLMITISPYFIIKENFFFMLRTVRLTRYKYVIRLFFAILNQILKPPWLNSWECIKSHVVPLTHSYPLSAELQLGDDSGDLNAQQDSFFQSTLFN